MLKTMMEPELWTDGGMSPREPECLKAQNDFLRLEGGENNQGTDLL